MAEFHNPTEITSGRTQKNYCYRRPEILSTGGYEKGCTCNRDEQGKPNDSDKYNTDEIVSTVLNKLKADGALGNIVVDEGKIADNVVKYLKDNDMLNTNMDTIVTDVINKIKNDELFVGKDGEDAKPEDVANILKSDSKFVESLKGEPGKKGDNANPEDVANILKSDDDFVASLKGEPGEDADVKEIKEALKNDSEFMESLKAESAEAPTAEEVATELKNDSTFVESLKGEPGESGKDSDPEDVANILKSDDDFVASLKGEPGEDADVKEIKEALKNDSEFTDSIKDDSVKTAKEYTDQLRKDIKNDIVNGFQKVLDDNIQMGMFVTNGYETDDPYIVKINSNYLSDPIKFAKLYPNAYCNGLSVDENGYIKLTAGKKYSINAGFDMISIYNGHSTSAGWSIYDITHDKNLYYRPARIYSDHESQDIDSDYDIRNFVFSPEEDTDISIRIAYSEDSSLNLTRIYISIIELKQPVVNNINSDSYMPEERVVGTWFNGKPLYERTVKIVYAEVPDTNKNDVHGTANVRLKGDIDMLFAESSFILNDYGDQVTTCGEVSAESGNFGSCWFATAYPGQPDMSVMGINFAGNHNKSDATAYVKVRYTKTNDDPVSGGGGGI